MPGPGKFIWPVVFVAYMFSATSLNELLKIPFMAGHYFEYAKEENGNSLINFIVGHYCHEDGTDDDASEDNKLPFKSVEIPVPFSFVSLAPSEPLKTLPVTFLMPDRHFIALDDAFIPTQFTDMIWQPPRNC